MAENIGSKIEIVSTETEEGDQFKNLGGIGAILRFRMR
jgi:peptide chain release factor subunit 1